MASLVAVLANFQQPASDNFYQREHSLVKPYQGSGMVSNQSRDIT